MVEVMNVIKLEQIEARAWSVLSLKLQYIKQAALGTH